MPRLSTTGQAVTPVLGAAAPLAVNGVVVPTRAALTISAPAWRRDQVLALQACGAGGCQVIEYDVAAGQQLGILYDAGANEIVAGGGVVAWQAKDGYHDTHGRHEPAWRALDVDPDTGAILVSPTNGTDLRIVTVSATYHCADGQVAMQASYRSGTVWFTRDYRNWQRWPDGLTCPVPMSNLRHGGDDVVVAVHGEPEMAKATVSDRSLRHSNPAQAR